MVLQTDSALNLTVLKLLVLRVINMFILMLVQRMCFLEVLVSVSQEKLKFMCYVLDFLSQSYIVVLVVKLIVFSASIMNPPM